MKPISRRNDQALAGCDSARLVRHGCPSWHNQRVTEDDIIRFATSLPGVVAVTASEANAAPEASWGDSFFFYDPDDSPAHRRFPFATIVTKDYDGFDTSSHLNRPGVFRLNVAVGRERFQELFGYPPAGHSARSTDIDYTVLDQVIPHPAYAVQGWASILCPGIKTTDEARSLITHAHQRAVERYRARH
jgi:hypothetical protein